MYFRSFRFMQTCPFSLTRCARFAFFYSLFFQFLLSFISFARPLWHDAGNGCEIVKRESLGCIGADIIIISTHIGFIHFAACRDICTHNARQDTTRHEAQEWKRKERERDKNFFSAYFRHSKWNLSIKCMSKATGIFEKRQQNAALKTFCHFYIHIVFGVCAMHDVGVCMC